MRGRPWITVVFGIAFGYFEAACVVYLKRLDLLGQLAVGQQPIENVLIAVEVGREVASLVLLVAWALAAGRSRDERLGHFALVFGLWDLFYYVFLRLAIGWPEGLLDWDVLFLIPAPWYGPVLAPVLVSVLLVVGGWVVAVAGHAGVRLRFRSLSVGSIALGCAGILAAFLWNADVREPFPEHFPWVIFWPAWTMAAAGTGLVLRDLARDGG